MWLIMPKQKGVCLIITIESSNTAENNTSLRTRWGGRFNYYTNFSCNVKRVCVYGDLQLSTKNCLLVLQRIISYYGWGSGWGREGGVNYYTNISSQVKRVYVLMKNYSYLQRIVL